MSEATTILIGDLLVRGEMATPRDMADAVPISLKTGLPIGRVLIGAGSLTEAYLSQALLAQSLIRDSLLSIDLAVQALRIVVREGFNLEQSLRIVGWQPESFANENRLGQLLLAAEAITADQLDEALTIFYTAGLPLARVLVLRGYITNIVAYAALSSQQLLRESKLTREQAIQCVRSATTSRATIEDNYVNGYLRLAPGNTVRLGELLVLAHMAKEGDVVSAVEAAIKRGETLGEVLVSRGVIRDDELKRALEAQRLCTKGELDSAKAGDVLRKANYERISMEEALNTHAPAYLVRPDSMVDLTEDRDKETRSWLEEVQSRTTFTRLQRSDQETRARQLGSRLLQKIEALFTRNSYLKNIMDKERQDEVQEDREELAELHTALEQAADFDECMQLVDKLIAKVETFSYHNGYLRSRLDTISTQLEMAEKVREAQETASAWRDRANTALISNSNPAVLVRYQSDVTGTQAAGEALVTTLLNVIPETNAPEPFVMAHDVTPMLSGTIPVQPQPLSKAASTPAKAKKPSRKKKR